MKVTYNNGNEERIELRDANIIAAFDIGNIESVQFTEFEDIHMAKLQRMAKNPDPQEHPSEADLDLLDFYNKYSD